MLKKLVCLILAAAVMWSLCPIARAEDSVGLSAPSALLMDCASGQVLFEKNAHEKRPCASITKVMTMCLVFEAIEDGRLSYDSIVTASPRAAAQVGSDIWLVEGEQMSVRDLLKAVAVVSANDAAVALAEAVSGTEQAFVSLMNEKAKSLGMKETLFKNCNGLDEEGHLTSAYDVALMSRELMKHEDVSDFVTIWLDYIRDGATQLVNTNSLVKSYDGITGLKTGTTTLAGACISATAERGGTSLIAVILGDKTTDERFSDAAALLDYGFNSFCTAVPQLPSELPESIEVERGMSDSVATQFSPNGSFLIRAGDEGGISCEVKMPEMVAAPIKKGQKIGSVEYRLGDKSLGEFPVTAKSDVEEIRFSGVFGVLLRSFFGL